MALCCGAAAAAEYGAPPPPAPFQPPSRAGPFGRSAKRAWRRSSWPAGAGCPLRAAIAAAASPSDPMRTSAVASLAGGLGCITRTDATVP